MEAGGRADPPRAAEQRTPPAGHVSAGSGGEVAGRPRAAAAVGAVGKYLGSSLSWRGREWEWGPCLVRTARLRGGGPLGYGRLGPGGAVDESVVTLTRTRSSCRT